MTAAGIHPAAPGRAAAETGPPGSEEQVLVLGIGNLLWADEGFGVRAVEHFHRRYACPPRVTCLDGGTQGLYLLQPIRDAEVVVVFDAVDLGKPPGTLCAWRDDEAPQYVSAKKMSLHQTGFQEVLALASLLRRRPLALLLIGVQPAELDDYGGGLRPEIKAQLQPAVDLAAAFLAGRGVPLSPRPAPLPAGCGPGCSVLTVDRYEQGRPPPASGRPADHGRAGRPSHPAAC